MRRSRLCLVICTLVVALVASSCSGDGGDSGEPDVIVDVPELFEPSSADEEGVEAALMEAYSSLSGAPVVARWIENGDQLIDLIREAQETELFAGSAVLVRTIEFPDPIECGVRFRFFPAGSCARVDYAVRLADDNITGPYEAALVRTADRWIVTARSWCENISILGIRCPADAIPVDLPDYPLQVIPPEREADALEAEAALKQVFAADTDAEAALVIEAGERLLDVIAAARANPRVQGARAEAVSAKAVGAASCGMRHSALPAGSCFQFSYAMATGGGESVEAMTTTMVRLGDRWMMPTHLYCDLASAVGVPCPDWVDRSVGVDEDLTVLGTDFATGAAAEAALLRLLRSDDVATIDELVVGDVAAAARAAVADGRASRYFYDADVAEALEASSCGLRADDPDDVRCMGVTFSVRDGGTGEASSRDTVRMVFDGEWRLMQASYCQLITKLGLSCPGGVGELPPFDGLLESEPAGGVTLARDAERALLEILSPERSAAELVGRILDGGDLRPVVDQLRADERSKTVFDVVKARLESPQFCGSLADGVARDGCIMLTITTRATAERNWVQEVRVALVGDRWYITRASYCVLASSLGVTCP